MQKLSQLTPDQQTNYLLRHLFGGTTAGVGVSSLINLLHSIRASIKEREDEKKRNKPDEDTIVLTLPPKVSEVKWHERTVKQDKPDERAYQRIHNKKQFRSIGRFDKNIKDAQNKDQPQSVTVIPQPNDMVLGALLTLAGGTGGYALSNYIYDMYRKKKIEKEIDKARIEYLDKLINTGSKMAASITDSLELEPLYKYMEKSAQTSFQHGPVNIAATIFILTLLAGLGGSAFFMKKILDTKLNNAINDPNTWRAPKIKRILFQSGDNKPPVPRKSDKNKDGDAGDIGQMPMDISDEPTPVSDENILKASMAIILDSLNGKQALTHDSKVIELAKKAGTSVDKLYKWADDRTSSPDALRRYLDNNPEFVDALTNASFKKNIPLIGGAIHAITPNFIRRRINELVKSRMVAGEQPGIASKLIRPPNEFLSQQMDTNKELRDALLSSAARKAGYGTAYNIFRAVPGIGYSGSLIGKELAKVELDRRAGKITNKKPLPKYEGIGSINLKKIHPDIPGSWDQLQKASQLDPQSLLSAITAPNSEDKPKDNNMLKAKEDAEYIAKRIRLAAKDPKSQQFINRHQAQIMAALATAIEDAILDADRRG